MGPLEGVKVLGRMTGWGQEGPLSQAPGHDLKTRQAIAQLPVALDHQA